ncbi:MULTISPECIES: type II toxin-antitoxin system VapC family toxin [unclassified Moraxella]|uniref:type II toxin-antitoxin system VapC family toxin n=1 Tax=unclassified Moraxella TaxID=2685852 RepID=UPI003AF516F4
MNALDTNILVRFFVDDPNDTEAFEQRNIAKEIMRLPCYVPLTVILEVVWVLFSRYNLAKETITDILLFLLDMENIEVQESIAIKQATSLFLQGMDFADALHLCQTNHCDRLYTFDRKFIKKSLKLNTSPLAILPKI